VETFGSENSPDILFIHGAGGCAEIWRDLASLFTPDISVAAIDLSGHGGSPRKAAPHTLGDYVADVLSAVRASGGKPVLCGHSMGGAVAAQLALENPDAIGGLILLGSGARLRVLPAIFDQLAADFAAAVKSFPAFAFGPAATPEARQKYVDLMLRADPAVTIEDFRICDSFDIIPRLGEITLRTLVIGAEKDNLTPLKYSQFLQSGIPGARLEILPGAGHISMLECPALIAPLVRDFIAMK